MANNDEGQDKVLSEDYAFFMESTSIEWVCRRQLVLSHPRTFQSISLYIVLSKFTAQLKLYKALVQSIWTAVGRIPYERARKLSFPDFNSSWPIRSTYLSKTSSGFYLHKISILDLYIYIFKKNIVVRLILGNCV